MPMVWYIPPLSPVVDALTTTGNDGEEASNLFGAIEALRIPKEYLAELFTAGDTDVITQVLKRLAAMRSTMRDVNLGHDVDPSAANAVGMDEASIREMYRLLAIAKYEERYVIPAAHTEQAQDLEETGCSLDFDEGPGMYGSGPFGEASGAPVPVAVENFHALRRRQTAGGMLDTSTKRGRVNLLNWDGKGAPTGMFPDDGEPQ
jgi:nitrate reductase beta subunit